ncbi:MAG TPA: serine/threonine protein kinase [Cyanothece sp. UBA12306]|nr:serine/threonine protein kinase [Cyanothece sp. UBA12306]
MKPISLHRSRYRILGLIGQGQFGRVYCGVNRQTGELVALKDLNPQRFPTNRFLREFSYLVSLRHPNIVSCRAIEHHANGRYLVMDYCEAGTLRDLMNAEGKLSLTYRLNLITDILLGLEQAHDNGIVHCDIKPENILLSLTNQGWKAKITDFGIARLSQEEQNLGEGRGYTGSPAYMAPERSYGQHSAACDLYSVGIMLYELIVGERPFSGLPGDLILAHLNQRVTIPDIVPFALKKTIETALEKLPQRRFASAKQMLKAIRQAAEVVEPQTPQRVFAPPELLPQAKNLEILEQTSLKAAVSHLAVKGRQIYLGMWKHLSCQTYVDSSLMGEAIAEHFISFPDPIIELNLRTQGCFVLTRASTRLPVKYNLYCWSPSLNLTNASVEEYQVCPPIEARQLTHAIDLKGRWLALASQSNDKDRYSQFQLLKLPDLLSIHPPVRSPLPPQLLPLDSCHGLALFPYQYHGKQRTYFYFFNRRGLIIKGFSLPLMLFSLTPLPQSPYQLFGIDANDPDVGILINLKPLKVTRVALNFSPKFIVGQSFGYVLANSQGQIILLDQDGFRIGYCNLSLKITAMTNFGESQLLLASWSKGQGNLFKFNLSTMLDVQD